MNLTTAHRCRARRTGQVARPSSKTFAMNARRGTKATAAGARARVAYCGRV